MFGRKKTIICPAGEWTTIIRSRFAQMPAVWDIHFHSEDGDVAGEYEETKSSWVFPGTPVSGQLQEHLTFERGYWNTFYWVRVRPRTPVTAEIR
ncbi:MAG TPA: hypothetical protein VF766_04830 [Pyrinomonadaceae bacterium]